MLVIRSDVRNKESFFVWSEPQRGREREKERLIFTLSAQFPFYFLPEDPCLQNVQSMLSVDRRLWNLPKQKKIEIKETEQERERETFLLSPVLQHRKTELLPRKPSPPCFFHFLSQSSRNTELPLQLEYLDRTPVTRSDIEGEGKTNARLSKVHQPLFLSCITPNWCFTWDRLRQTGTEAQMRLKNITTVHEFPAGPSYNWDVAFVLV